MRSLSFIVFGALILAPALAHAEDMAPAALNSFSSVPAALTSAQVLDQNGHVLGTGGTRAGRSERHTRALSLSAPPVTAKPSSWRLPPSALTAMC